MPAYLLIAKAKDAHNQPIPLVPGEGDRIFLHFPGDIQAAFNFAKQHNIGGNWDRRDYGIWDLRREYGNPVVLGIQRVPPAPLSQQHVQGSQPVGIPVGQPNQNRPAGPPDGLGFEPIADGDLSGVGDGMFETNGDMQGTVSDIYDGGRVEVKRPK